MSLNAPSARTRRRYTGSQALLDPHRHSRDTLLPIYHPPDLRADRLDSWKEIAVFLNREVRTVQRWEKSEALPIHRHIHPRGHSVYTFKQELLAWQTSRSTRKQVPPLFTPPRRDWLYQLCYLCCD